MELAMKPPKRWDPGIEKAVKAVRGGVSALARELGINRQNIYDWNQIPADHIVAIEQITGVPREQLRPDLYRRESEREGMRS